MPAHVWIAVLAVVLIVADSAALVWLARRRTPPTREAKLRAARKAARWMRRGAPRHHRDTFERGEPARDRFGGPLLENSAYGDAAGSGGGGGGGAD